MKLILDAPYNNDWKHGYLVTNPEGRKTVILYNSQKSRSSVSYARYLLSTWLGKYIDTSLHVDHIDGDKTNDSLLNLQLLTPKENNKKTAKGKTYKEFICPVCSTHFRLEARQSHKITPCCSRQCGGKKSHWK